MSDPAPPPSPSPDHSWVRSAPLWAVLAVVLLAFIGGWVAARSARRTAPAAVQPATVARELAAANRAVQALEARVARLEADQALVARVSASGLAIVNLTAAAENPSGFGPALAAAERSLPASPDLVALRGLAAAGAPTRAGLTEAFPAVAARARAALRAEGGGERLSGLGRALGRVFGQEPTQPRGVGAEAVLARAEARLASGDLAGATDALEALPEPARAAAAPWAADARRRLEIDRRLAAVRLLALGQFAAVPGAAPR
ncbi:MAG: hypothetical protein KY446_03110 [Proteobacteria bacterium]|nr:hypothetical protein [Pseudomonadota bacterium]